MKRQDTNTNRGKHDFHLTKVVHLFKCSSAAVPTFYPNYINCLDAGCFESSFTYGELNYYYPYTTQII